jgi:hypothetical protein
MNPLRSLNRYPEVPIQGLIRRTDSPLTPRSPAHTARQPRPASCVRLHFPRTGVKLEIGRLARIRQLAWGACQKISMSGEVQRRGQCDGRTAHTLLVGRSCW